MGNKQYLKSDSHEVSLIYYESADDPKKTSLDPAKLEPAEGASRAGVFVRHLAVQQDENGQKYIEVPEGVEIEGLEKFTGGEAAPTTPETEIKPEPPPASV